MKKCIKCKGDTTENAVRIICIKCEYKVIKKLNWGTTSKEYMEVDQAVAEQKGL